MLENPVECLEQSFSYEAEIVGQRISKELVSNGYDIIVTDDNKKDFIRMICETKMKNGIQDELTAFLRGFYLMIPPHFLSLFSVSEFQILVGGIPTIDLEQMKMYAQLSGFKKDSEQIIWLWEILTTFSQKELGALIFFLSGMFCELTELISCYRKY